MPESCATSGAPCDPELTLGQTAAGEPRQPAGSPGSRFAESRRTIPLETVPGGSAHWELFHERLAP